MKTRIMYLRKNYNGDGVPYSSNTNPVGCIAIDLSEPTEGENPTRQIRYQVSVLNPSDKFDRKVARQLAKGRLVESPLVIPRVKSDIDMTGVTEQVMLDIAWREELPSRARKAAARWFGWNSVQQCIDNTFFTLNPEILTQFKNDPDFATSFIAGELQDESLLDARGHRDLSH